MKKSKMMRLASCMLVLTLLTTCMISGTFAKYVTAADASDSARVADWGVTAAVTGNAFKTEYERTDTSYTVTANTVVSSTDDKLVAPGTNGTFGGVALTGSPEVAVRVSYENSVVDIKGWLVDGSTFYCPLEFNINGTVIEGIDYTSEVELEEAILSAITKGAGDYAPNTDLSTIDAINGEYTWSWPFSTSDVNDVKDTKLGDIEAADPDKDANTISIVVKTTVTQID